VIKTEADELEDGDSKQIHSAGKLPKKHKQSTPTYNKQSVKN